MPDVELEKLREQLYRLAQTVFEVSKDELGRSVTPNSTLDMDDRRDYDLGGQESVVGHDIEGVLMTDRSGARIGSRHPEGR